MWKGLSSQNRSLLTFLFAFSGHFLIVFRFLYRLQLIFKLWIMSTQLITVQPLCCHMWFLFRLVFRTKKVWYRYRTAFISTHGPSLMEYGKQAWVIQHRISNLSKAARLCQHLSQQLRASQHTTLLFSEDESWCVIDLLSNFRRPSLSITGILLWFLQAYLCYSCNNYFLPSGRKDCSITSAAKAVGQRNLSYSTILTTSQSIWNYSILCFWFWRKSLWHFYTRITTERRHFFATLS